MKLTELAFRQLLDAFRSPAPTPGGGSASAMTGAVGAALLAMIGAMPRHRAASEEDVDRLRAAGERSAAISGRLGALVDEDAASYDAVVAAYKLPKDSDAERTARGARIQEALTAATEIPLEVMRQCEAAMEAAAVIARFGNPSAASDVGVALELLAAGSRGARLNVDINLGGIKTAGYADTVGHEAARLEAETARAADAARAYLKDSGRV
jgi:formiminotetrahydrofolate cyclodeaminase